MIGVALQEWAAICDRLGTGQLMLAVRKGGIHERHGGFFALEHQRFALMPTYLHQDATRLRDPAPLPTDPKPGHHRITSWAEAAAIWKVTDRQRLYLLDLPWTATELDTRFAYRDQPFLFVLALRVHQLTTPATIPDHASYAGCRSWIPLRNPVDDTGSLPVVDARRFANLLSRLDGDLGPRTPDPGPPA